LQRACSRADMVALFCALGRVRLTRHRRQAEYADAVFCEDWQFRLECAARTWMRPHPMESLMCAPRRRHSARLRSLHAR
jgi:hypothetical protein